MNPTRVSYAVSVLLALALHGWLARTREMSASTSTPAPVQPEAQPHPRSFVTTHSGVFGGTTITYLATAADTLLTDSNGNPTAAVFTFTYARQAVKDTIKRPVLFIFNGGPAPPRFGFTWAPSDLAVSPPTIRLTRRLSGLFTR